MCIRDSNKGEEVKDVYLPEDTWVHIWTGKEYKGGHYSIEVPMGYPAVFYKKDSEYKNLFAGLKEI